MTPLNRAASRPVETPAFKGSERVARTILSAARHEANWLAGTFGRSLIFLGVFCATAVALLVLAQRM